MSAAAPPSGLFCSAPVVRLLDADPDLGRGLDPAEREQARQRVVARSVVLEPGPWGAASAIDAADALLGLLVVDGLLTRTVTVAGTAGAELLGAGDVLRPWDDHPRDGCPPHCIDWAVATRSTIAVLDRRTAVAVGQWPTLGAALLARSVQRSRGLGLRLALLQLRRGDARLRLLFWHLAERWGKVTSAGVVVPLPLTHRLIGQLVAMRRPSVSTALGQLARSGEITRRADGSWLLTGTPPYEDNVAEPPVLVAA